jgi:demethylmenaquinone methyltransferase/2-methoxy-6-polyprenyl-1,4-benzoquinol methylase
MPIFDKWFDPKGRQEQFDSHIRRSKTAWYGFMKVPEAEKQDRIYRHFESVAEKYDLMNTLLSFGIHYAWKREAVRMLGLRPGARVLDVCGGTGDLAVMASGHIGPDGRVAVYDINRAMMQAGRPKVAAQGLDGRIAFVQGNAEAIAFSENSFDAAMVSFGIRNVTHMEKAFGEMYRALKPGGKILCLEFSKPVNPVFRWLYDFYSFHIMPALGQLIARNRNAYLLLTESIRLFPMPDELASRLEDIGFSDVFYRRMTNGIAVAHIGVKKQEHA